MIIKRIFKPINFLKDFIIAKNDPMGVQNKVLKKILRRNKNTVYGERYNFSDIKSIENFQNKVPIITYPDIANYIEEMKNGKNNILIKDRVIYFATSSGTTSDPKFIPITKKRMDFHRGEFLIWMKYMLKDGIRMIKGKTLYFAGGDLNGYTRAKIAHGNISGYLVKNSSRFIKSKLIVDSDVLNIKNFDEKMKKIAILSLLEKNISQIAFASAVQAIIFFDFLKENRDELILEVKKKNKKRWKTLNELEEFKAGFIWPKLWLINCIKSGANNFYLNVVKEKIAQDKIVIMDPGIMASEGRISLGIGGVDGVGVIPLNESFFEFQERIDDEFLPEIITVDKLKKDKVYKVIMTTQEGLYRYDIEDIVEVVGFMDKIPLIKFVSRNRFLNITEEHAPETEIIKGVQSAIKKLDIKIRSFTVIPYLKKENKPRYEILIENIDPLGENLAIELLNEIDGNWQDYILTYKETRNEFGRMDPPILSIVENGSYDKIDSETLILRGQAKPVNVTEDINYRNKFKIEKSFGM